MSKFLLNLPIEEWKHGLHVGGSSFDLLLNLPIEEWKRGDRRGLQDRRGLLNLPIEEWKPARGDWLRAPRDPS